MTALPLPDHTSRCGYDIDAMRPFLDGTVVVRMRADDGFTVYLTESEYRDVIAVIDDVVFVALLDGIRARARQSWT